MILKNYSGQDGSFLFFTLKVIQISKSSDAKGVLLMYLIR